jgi:hypothetical protein
MIKILPKIICSLVILNLYSLSIAQDVDSLSLINDKYDSILHTDENAMDVLFYKHKNDIPINNLGPFGSPSYYPTTFFLKDNHAKKKPVLGRAFLYLVRNNY